jgi:hypothetical protein
VVMVVLVISDKTVGAGASNAQTTDISVVDQIWVMNKGAATSAVIRGTVVSRMATVPGNVVVRLTAKHRISIKNL